MSFSSLLLRGLNSGHWTWNDQTNNLEFVRLQAEKKRRHQKEVKTPTAINGLTYVTLKVDIKFKFSVSEVDLMDFKHYMKEKNKSRTDSNVITIEDVKVVAIFMCCQKLPALFHQFYSLLKINQLLRACIVYMEFYLQTCENVIKTQSYISAKIQGETSYDRMMRDLNDLRVLIGRFYAGIIFAELGTGNTRKISRTDEILLFEYFLRVSTIVIWIALERKYLNTIKKEISRIFRTEYFSNICKVEGSNLVDEVHKKNLFVLQGRLPGGNPRKNPHRLISTSPVVNNLLYMSEPKLVTIDKEDLESLRDERLKFLMKYIFEPEQNIRDEGVFIGILGYHKRLFDPLLQPCTKRNLKLLVTGSPMDISEDRRKLREVALETSLRESETQHLHHFDHLPRIPVASQK